MNKIDEQLFETVDGLAIRYCFTATANSVEISIENITYSQDRARKFRHILVIALGLIILNLVIQQHALNFGILATIAIKCYILSNLIEYGKQRDTTF